MSLKSQYIVNNFNWPHASFGNVVMLPLEIWEEQYSQQFFSAKLCLHIRLFFIKKCHSFINVTLIKCFKVFYIGLSFLLSRLTALFLALSLSMSLLFFLSETLSLLLATKC